MIRDRIVCKICGGWKDIDPATGEAMSCDTCDDVADEQRSEEHTSELQSQSNLVCRLLLEKKKHTSRPPVYASCALAPQALHSRDGGCHFSLSAQGLHHLLSRAPSHMCLASCRCGDSSVSL